MFFIRSILGLGVVFALLPVAPEDQDKIEYVSPIEAIGAAAVAMKDMSGFCTRNPMACETGGKAAVALGYKAKYGAQQLLDRVNESDEQSNVQTATIAPEATPEAAAIVHQALPTKIVLPAATDQPAPPTPRARPSI